MISFIEIFNVYVIEGMTNLYPLWKVAYMSADMPLDVPQNDIKGKT